MIHVFTREDLTHIPPQSPRLQNHGSQVLIAFGFIELFTSRNHTNIWKSEPQNVIPRQLCLPLFLPKRRVIIKLLLALQMFLQNACTEHSCERLLI